MAITLALSDGTTYQPPDTGRLDRQIQRLQRRLARAKRGSNRRRRVQRQLARLHARRADIRKELVEQTSTWVARGYDLIRVEDLRVKQMTRSARRLLRNWWPVPALRGDARVR